MVSNKAWYGIKESVVFFSYCANTVGSTKEWLKIREVIDKYLASKPYVGNRIANTRTYMLSLEMAKCDYCFYYGVIDNPGLITLLELHPNK